MPRLGWLFLGISLALAVSLSVSGSRSAASQAKVEFLETTANYYFGGQVNFWARIRSTAPPESVQIFYKSQGDANTSVGQANISQDEILYTLDLTSHPLVAFSEVIYYFGIKLPTESIVSPTYSFYYEDNRFNWQAMQNGPFQVHWYVGDLAFGQTVLDAAQSGLLKAQTILDLPAPEKVNIYVYATGAEMKSTEMLGGLKLVAGHASPDLGLIVVSLPPGPDQRMETERQVPHELMHILLYQRLGNDSFRLPIWFNEGLASFNEAQANPDYYTSVDEAIKKNAIIPMKTLCRSFRSDEPYWTQSYAQADSFIRYLYSQYGSSGLESLMENYANGVDCERGTVLALGKSLDQLERRWLTYSFNENVMLNALGFISPWLVILVVTLFAPVFLTFYSMKVKDKNKTGALVSKG